jgi:hypothetical protein
VRLDQQPHGSSPPASLIELLLLLHASVELPEASLASDPHVGELPQLSGVVIAPLHTLVGAGDHVPPSRSLGTRIQPHHDILLPPLKAELYLSRYALLQSLLQAQLRPATCPHSNILARAVIVCANSQALPVTPALVV